MAITKEEIGAAINTLRAIADAIRELREVPYGVFYARVMPYVDLATLEKIIGILVKAELVENKNNVLRWIGPAI